ncbi:PepSY domain-containing protein [Pseudonocardia hispaniensis]|uniref:PepSY domain-containing protein n=1 Tax=Pseudonocardia hispaniensis TaxID=904933 RepID=A0ABW1J2J1_9PSEU
MRKLIWIGGAALAAAAAVAVGAGAAAALPGATPGAAAVSVAAAQDTDGPETPDVPLTGSDLERATKAALAHTGGGTVTETETGDDAAAYGVEIRTPDGRHVEVNLDRDFAVTGQEADDNDGD